MKIFCQVVQSGSFTRAAELLDISTPMASKYVAHLEKTLGIRLLYRNNRTLKLTEQGEHYFQQCLIALDILEQAADQATANTQQPQGTLRISAPIWFACDKFARLIHQYQQHYPKVELIISLTNRLIDLNSDGEDLALRLTQNPAANLIAKPLGSIPFYLVAAPTYLAKHGTPQTPEQATALHAILPTYADMSHEIAESLDHSSAPVHLSGKIRSDNTLMIASLIRAGAGIGYMPSWLAEEDLNSGRLIRLLPEYAFRTPQLYAIYASRRSMNARLRSFIDFMAQQCG